MANESRFAEARLDDALDALLLGADLLSLHTADPTADGTVGELVDDTDVGEGYVQQAIAMTASSGAATANDGVIEFTAAGSDWPEVTHIGIWDGAVFLASRALVTARTITDGNTLRFAIGAIAFSHPLAISD